MAAIAGFYRRTLPSPPAIEFATPEGKQLFTEALVSGNMEGFFKLISYYQTQSEPAYCGLATLASVLNALSIDPGRKWKGPWRWFDDTMLDCCEPLEQIKVNGISFGKVACLAHCNGANVDAFRANESTVDNFRNYVISCTSSEDCHMVVSYHRGYLKQTGSGHFSPIGGYHVGKDMVLILDVARFKYPPHWVPLPLLWDAINTIDEDTGLYRGFMLLSRLESATSILYTVSCRQVNCDLTAKYLTESIPQLLSSDEIKIVQDILTVILESTPTDLRQFINWVFEVRKSEDGRKLLSEEEKGRLAMKEELLKQVQETELYKYVLNWLLSACSVCNTSVGCQSSLYKMASKVCCQGAQVLCGTVDSCSKSCCKLTKPGSSYSDHLEATTTESGRVVVTDSEHGVEMLAPFCQRKSDSLCENDSTISGGKYPSIDDVLTVLILALPPTTWFCLKDSKLREEFSGIVSTDSLPDMLQQEVLHLRRQLDVLTAELLHSNPPT